MSVASNMLVFLLVLAFHVPTSYACSCTPRGTPMPYFLCCFDYVIRGTVVKDSSKEVQISRIPGNVTTAFPPTSFSGRVYTIDMTAVYKGYEKNDFSIQLRTATDHGLCGIDLTLQREYLLAGTSKGYIYHCDWHQAWADVPGSIRTFLPSLSSCVGERDRVDEKLVCRTNFSHSSLRTSHTSAVPMPTSVLMPSTSMPSSVITSTPASVPMSIITPNTSLYTSVFTSSLTSVPINSSVAASPSVSNPVFASVVIFLILK